MAASNSPAEKLITKNIDVWTSAIKKRGSQGRGSSKKIELYGIKKLRELILELAVRGLLVPQDPNDEPASVLLEKIAAEKEQLIKDGKIKKQKALPEISDEEAISNLPSGWVCARLGSVMNVLNGRAYKKHEMLQAGTPLLRVGNLFTSKEWYYSDLELEPEKYIDNGDLIYAWSASFGPFIWDGGKVIYHYHIWKLDLYHKPSFDKYYLLNYLQSITASIKASGNGIAMIHMTKERMEKLVLPIAPLKEQNRIVAKVDELMALCDQLEQQTETSLSAHQTLVETLLNTLLNADQNSFDQAWERIAQHFDILFTTEHSIDQLKQTILQLAVMGKLVPQDPNDEPASVLLEKIAAEKEQLIKDKVIKKQKPLPPISENEKPFELPQGWEWVRFASLSNEIATGPFGSMIHKRDYIQGGVPLINPSHMINSRVVEDSAISVSAAKSEELRSYKLYENDIVMARRGEMGRCALITKREENWLCGTGSFVLRFNDKVSRDYILLLFRTRWVKDYLGGKSIGTTMTNLNHNILNRLPLLLPPLAEVPRIISRVSELMDLCEMLKKQISESRTTQLHLADAMAGQALN